MEPFAQWWGWAFGVRFGLWYISVYLKPSHWGIDWHHHATCCKWWLVVGPFEINRVWSDDEYPFKTDVE